MNPRRERFRQAMARFEPTADPAGAIKDGLYVEPPSAFATRTLRTLEIRPRSSHLIAGPSGSGKTTELRFLEQLLKASGEWTPIFIDVEAYDALVEAPGGLIEVVKQQILRTQIHGGTSSKFEDVLLRAMESIPTAFALNRANHAGFKAIDPPVVLLLDSLDRLPVARFTALCQGDVKSLRELVSIVMVGPHAVFYGAAREIVDSFDYPTRQPTHDPHRGGPMYAFLNQVIRQRADEDLIPAESCTPLVEASGGILRDLIALAQLALEEAYVAGHERVEPTDVSRAIDTFGRKHIIGLDSEEIAILRRVRKSGNFVRVNDRDTSLLVTRRVLEYADEAGGASRYVIHPTLVPLLAQLGDS